MGIEIADDTLDAVQFWELFLGAVCDREAKIHASFDSETIRRILIAVAAVTRTKPENIGPLTLREIQDAFEYAVGFAPIEQAGVLLQRLPGLGRTAADTQDRRFVDTYILDGLRAAHVVNLLSGALQGEVTEDWLNPLSENGLLIVSMKLGNLNLVEEAVSFCRKYCRERNKTLIFDVICALLLCGEERLELSGVEIDGGHASTADFSSVRVHGLHISNSIIDKLVLSGFTTDGVAIERSIIGLLEGVSSHSGIPAWLKGNEISDYTSIATVSRIRSATISSNHKVLVTVLRKTYFQRGAARKEEALLRGLGQLVRSGTVDRILNRLISENLLQATRGDTGTLYVPVRSQTGRVGKMLAELNMSKDPVWEYVGAL
jgi:hypothetical protein